MIFRKQPISCAEARQIDLVSYLSSLGHEPARIRNFNYWYLSPLREEKTPSFKVCRRLNLWYDHGLGKGGNLIDFAILYNDCTVGEFLQTIRTDFSFHQPIPLDVKQPKKDKKTCITLIRERPLTSFFLIRYLYQRRIPIQIAKQFCHEVVYEINERKYGAIGFKNNAGGYELRNAFFKGSSTPKDVTTFEIGAKEVSIFEGFFDFLSYKTIDQNGQLPKSNFLILNSLSFFEKARPFMEQHDCIHLYLDRDKSGQNYTHYAMSLNRKYKDNSGRYANYKDFNAWIMYIGKSVLLHTEQNRVRELIRYGTGCKGI